MKKATNFTKCYARGAKCKLIFTLLAVLLFSALSYSNVFAQSTITAKWNFSTGNSLTQTLACSGSNDAIYVESDKDNVKLIVEANGQTITSETGGLKFSPGVILKMPVNNVRDYIEIEISGTLDDNYRIYTFDGLIMDIHPTMWKLHFVDDGILPKYTANEVDAGYGYIGIEILKETTIKSITANLSITTAYTYYDEDTKTFYFKYDDKKFTHDPATVGNLNSQYEEVNTDYEDDGHFTFCEHLKPYWSSKRYDAKKVVFEDNFINYVNTTKPLKSCFGLFQGFSKLTEINGLDKINTGEVNDMSRMFLGCMSLTQEAIQHILNALDFSNVQMMSSMFEGAFVVGDGVDLELKDWNATKVVFVDDMFRESGIKNLKITNFGGNKIVDMRRMFYKCPKLESVEFDGWKGDDGVFAEAEAMFYESEKLQSVKLSGIHLGGECGYMFKKCKSLTTVDMSEVSFGRSPFDPFDWQFGFHSCSSLKDVKINGDFNLTKEERHSLQTLFYGCTSLDVLDLRTWDTKSIYNLAGLFGGDLGGGDPNDSAAVRLNTIFVADKFSCENEHWQYNWMFKNCIGLIGGNGYKYPFAYDEYPEEQQDKISQQYARVDDGDNPGYFTYAAIGDPLRYKIFYNLDGGEFDDANYPQSFTEEEDDLDIPTPKREGYVFTGWTGTSATGLSETEPSTEEVIIKKGSRGNRWYYAHWEKGYSITFDTKFDDLTIDPMLLKEKAPIDNLPEPSRVGYEFKGWKYGDNEVPKAMPAKNITLTAQWEIINYTITLDYDGGQLPDGKTNPTTYTVETPTFTLEKPVKTGYSFDGWDTGKAVDPDGVITKGSYDDIALSATWQINQYTITFDTDGGTEIAAIKQDYNTAITKPADPVKTGYSFIGWGKEIPATMPAEDITITAKWQINTHTITFDTDGGSEIKPITYEYNAAITKPADPVKTGYTFKEWDNDIPSNMPDQDLSFKAQWQINKYTITFNTDCNIDIELMELDYGSDVKLPANLERKGFTFLGWDKDIKTMPAENITLTAQWRDDRIAIDAEFHGEVSFPANADNYCNGSEKTVTIDFIITQGVASEFKLSFPNDVIPAVNGTIENDEGSIVITIPDNIESGVYTGKVVFVSADPEVYRPLESTITITATIPLRNAAVQLYTDMLIVDNHEGIYNAYQWYRNGEALPGATLLYYTEPKFDYNSLYTVKLSGDGKEMMSCPVEWLSTAKALKPSIKVYPNPAKQGENFTLEILDFDEDQNYDIVIFTANGTMVKKISNVEQKTSVTLPSGVYSGSLINGGEKKGFKLIVK